MYRVRPAGIETLLIQRTERQGDPSSGQVSLPGGRADPTDADPCHTALREMNEEVGLEAADLALAPRFVGLVPAPSLGLEVAAFVSLLRDGAASPWARDTEEVAGVFWLPEGELARTQRVERATFPGPATVDAALFEGHVVWGFTRTLLRSTLERLFPAPPCLNNGWRSSGL
ncbi:MAG: NUDIX hydrolase [Thermoplasmata archaeon]